MKHICDVISNLPAPSPLAGQHPTPPRWLIRINISSASSTTFRLATDFNDATRPTPQFSVSRDGSYTVFGSDVPFFVSFPVRSDNTRSVL